MYKELTAPDFRFMLGVPEGYTVDALLTAGTHPKSRAHPSFEEALSALGISATYEPIEDAFFGDIKSVITPYGRLWFDVIYGSAYASELVHVASLLGAKAVVHIGSFGALQSDVSPGDIVVPDCAYGNESTTRMYERVRTPLFFSAHKQLRAELAKAIDTPTRDGSIVSIQAMLAETAADVTMWKEEGLIGVEMECASLFAVADHFKVPAAAALYAADNLITNTLVISEEYAESQHHRETAKKRLYLAALKTLLSRMQK